MGWAPNALKACTREIRRRVCSISLGESAEPRARARDSAFRKPCEHAFVRPTSDDVACDRRIVASPTSTTSADAVMRGCSFRRQRVIVNRELVEHPCNDPTMVIGFVDGTGPPVACHVLRAATPLT